jgi:hypothetical protein
MRWVSKERDVATVLAILVILAFLLFGLRAFGVTHPRVELTEA